jgi:hypothetical protein
MLTGSIKRVVATMTAVRSLVLAFALVAAGAVATAPSATAGSKPAVSFTSVPTGTVTVDHVDISWVLNRGAKQVAGLTCALTAGTTTVSQDCGTVVATKVASAGSASFADLADGSYTYTVVAALTDGGSARASAGFTVAVPHPPVLSWDPTQYFYYFDPATTFTLHNSGGSAGDLAINLTGDNGFFLTGGSCQSSLPAGESCTVEVTDNGSDIGRDRTCDQGVASATLSATATGAQIAEAALSSQNIVLYSCVEQG